MFKFVIMFSSSLSLSCYIITPEKLFQVNATDSEWQVILEPHCQARNSSPVCPAQLGSGSGPGRATDIRVSSSQCRGDLLECSLALRVRLRGERLCGMIYTSSCKKAAVINVSHSMSVTVAPPDQPHSPPTGSRAVLSDSVGLSSESGSNSMLAPDGHAVSSVISIMSLVLHVMVMP
jgi:hypothetical protein